MMILNKIMKSAGASKTENVVDLLRLIPPTFNFFTSFIPQKFDNFLFESNFLKLKSDSIVAPSLPFINLKTTPLPTLGAVASKISTDSGLTSSIQSGFVTRDNTLDLSGSVVAGATVSIYDNGKFLGLASIADKSWVFTTPKLEDGAHNFKVVIALGVQSQSFGVEAVVDTVVNGTFSATIVTDTGNSKTITSGANTTDHTLGLSGTGEVGSAIKIYDGAAYLGQTMADTKGKWSFTTQSLSDGHHDFLARITDVAGNQKDVTGISVNLSTPEPITSPTSTHTWSTVSGWGSIDVLAAINNTETGKKLADVKAPNGTQWGVDSANINDAWSYSYTGKGIMIAAIDTGIDLKNADLTKGLSSYSWNFLNNTANVMDDNGHGTFVASEMIAANNGIGLTGACYDSTLMVLKALDANGSGSAASVCAAIKYAVDHGANIINMSLGGSDYPGYNEALQYTKDHNVLVVMAAGKGADGTPLNPASYAQQFSNCITVGALQQGSSVPGASCTLASFSNQAGSTLPYGFVDAAGQSVAGYTVGGGVASWSGTSMAAPIVSAAAALVWSADASATASHIAQTLYQTSHTVL